jgi:hypothetical protein
MPKRIAYWLMPDQGERRRWRSLIEDLADEYGGALFDPHVTIHVHPLDGNTGPEQVLEKCAASHRPVEGEIDGLAFSDLFTKSCYVSFKPCSAMQGISDRLKVLETIPGSYELDPHMSLFYGALSETQAQEIRSSTDLPRAVRFDAIRAMMIPGPVQSLSDVESWRILHECRLE